MATLLAALIALAAAPPAAGAEANLLRNPSFEHTLELPARGRQDAQASRFPLAVAHWQNRAAIHHDNAVARSGAASLRIDGPAKGYTFYRPTTASSVGLVPATAYVLSAWVRAQAPKGRGVSLWFGQMTPSGKNLAQSTWAKGTADWVRIEARFTTPPDHQTGWLRLLWDLEEGERAWVDDLCLRPASGSPPQAHEPTIAPAGGTHIGPVEVTLATDIPGAAIHYTIDGSDPRHSSTRYAQPFRLFGSATVKARVLHTGHAGRRVATAAFTLQPRRGPGVPFQPTGFGSDVAAWWARHLYNPAAPGHVARIA